MPRVTYPSRLEQKVLSSEAPGGAPVHVELVAPTIAASGVPFSLRVAVSDDVWLPSLACGRELAITDESGAELARVAFEAGSPAVAVIEDVTVQGDGFHRFAVELDGTTFHSNPVRVSANGTRNVYWGDPHVHTVLSNCHPDRCRSLNFCFTSGRYLTCLDFVGAADHVSNGRCEKSKWKEERTVADLYNDEGSFVTLPAYEASFKGMAGGDNNVYMRVWPDMFVDDFDEGTVKTMAEKLKERLPPEDFFIVPHHTTRTGKHGEIPDEIYLGADLLPVIEIHSRWGTSEYRGNPEPLEKIHPGPSYAVDLLNRGMKFGFIAGTDTHCTIPSGWGTEHLTRSPGFTAVFAPKLTRDEIYHGIRNRRCYATKGERIYLDAKLDGASDDRMLSSADAARRVVSGVVAGKSDVTSVELIRNGETLAEQKLDTWHGAFEFADDVPFDEIAMDSKYVGRFAYYYVRANCASGAKAWSSPWWMVDGQG